MADFNSETILSGMQIGNQWAAQRAHREQNAFNNQFRSKAEQDRLKAEFGDDTVYDSNGQVDIIGSSAKRRARSNLETSEAARGFSDAFQGLAPQAVPQAATQLPANAVERPPVIVAPVPVQEEGSVPDPQTGEVHPILRQQITPPDAPRFIPIEEPAPSRGAMGMTRANFFTHKPQAEEVVAVPLPPQINRPVQVPPQVLAAPVEPPPTSAIPRQISIPPAVLAQAARQPELPDMTGWSPARIRAFMATYPKVVEGRRKTDLELAQEENRLALERMRIQGRGDLADKNIEGRKDITEMVGEQKRESNQAKLDAVAAQVAGREAVAKANIAARQAQNLGQLPKLVGADNIKVTEYAKAVATKELAADIIDDAVTTLEDSSIPYHVRYTTAQSLFKTLNSSDYRSDAVNGEEAERIGRLLKLDLNPFHYYQTGRALPDMGSFLQQIKIKSADLKKQTAQLEGRINSIYQKHGTGSAQKPAATDVIIMVNPSGKSVQVPKDRVESAKKAGYK